MTLDRYYASTKKLPEHKLHLHSCYFISLLFESLFFKTGSQYVPLFQASCSAITASVGSIWDGQLCRPNVRSHGSGGS